MRSVKGIIIGFLLILLGFAAAQYSLIAAGILSAGGLAAVVVSALPKRAEKQEPQAAPGSSRACPGGAFRAGAAAGYSDRPTRAAENAPAAAAGGGGAV